MYDNSIYTPFSFTKCVCVCSVFVALLSRHGSGWFSIRVPTLGLSLLPILQATCDLRCGCWEWRCYTTSHKRNYRYVGLMWCSSKVTI